MYLNILKKDIRRKKTMNIILLLFMILAVMFVSSGLNNVFAVINGTDYYLDKAGIGDYVIITMGENSEGTISTVLDKAECVKGYTGSFNAPIVNRDKEDIDGSICIRCKVKIFQ